MKALQRGSRVRAAGHAACWLIRPLLTIQSSVAASALIRICYSNCASARRCSWELINISNDTHAIHIHIIEFEVRRSWLWCG